MPRKKHNQVVMRPFGERLHCLMSRHLRMTPRELSTKLGYSNDSTIRKALAGQTGLSIEQLVGLSRIKTPSGNRPNLDWLLTGHGPHVFPIEPSESESQETQHLLWMVQTLSQKEIKALKVVLGASAKPV